MRLLRGSLLFVAVALAVGACSGEDSNDSSLVWSRVTGVEAVFGGAYSQVMFDVTAGGPGLVAVGRDGPGGDWAAAVWTSPDGTSWSRVPHDETVFGGADTQFIASVTVGGPGLVAVGLDGSGGDDDAAVWTSLDGSTWSRVLHDEAVFGGADNQWMNTVTSAGPGLVAVGGDGSGGDDDAAVWTSSDGIAWSRVPHDEAVFGGADDQVMGSVTAGGPGLVAVGWEVSAGDLDAAVWTSPDGIAWSRVPHDEAVFGGANIQGMFGVTAGGPGLVAVGGDGSGGDDDAAVWTSPDGTVWSRVPHDEAVFGGADYQEMSGVTAGGPGLVAVGRDGSNDDDLDSAVWTSPDGLAWSRVPHDEAVFGGESFQLMWSVTAGGPGLVSVGADRSGGDFDSAVWVLAPAATAMVTESTTTQLPTFGDEEAERCFLAIAYDLSSSQGDVTRYGGFAMNMTSTFEYPDNPTQEDLDAVYAATIGIPVEELFAFLVVSQDNVLEQLGPTPHPVDDPDGFGVWHEAWGRDFWKRWIELNPAQAEAFCASYPYPNPHS